MVNFNGNNFTTLYRIYFEFNQDVFECYGFNTKNNIVALYADQSLKLLIGTLDEKECELFEAIGKVEKRYVNPTPITLKKLQLAKKTPTNNVPFQIKLF